MAVNRDEAERGLAELLRIYRDAQEIIAQQVRIALIEGRLGRKQNRQAAYDAIVKYLDQVGLEADPIAKQLIENAWREGDQSVQRAMPNALDFDMSLVNREAMEEMQQALMDTLAEARRTVGRQAADVFRQAGLRSVSLGLLGARGSSRAVSQDLVENLTKKGVKSFVDKAGRSWKLKDYAQMVARTTTREAVVAAQVQRMSSLGIEYARVSMNGSKCPICGPQEGVLVAIGSGRSMGGEQAASLDALPSGGPPFHPNCRHWLDPETDMFSDSEPGSVPSSSQPPLPPAQPRAAGPQTSVQIDEDVWPKTAKRIDHAAQQSEAVHRVPFNIDARRMPRRGRPPGTKAAFARHRDDWTNRWLEVRQATTEFQVSHELGHAIENDIFDNKMHYLKRPGARILHGVDPDSETIAKWWNAVQDSPTFKSLATDIRPGKFQRYMQSSEECWARAYSQWIATRGSSEILRKQLDDIRDGEDPDIRPYWQWPDDEFEKIAEALEDMLREAGLL